MQKNLVQKNLVQKKFGTQQKNDEKKNYTYVKRGYTILVHPNLLFPTKNEKLI